MGINILAKIYDNRRKDSLATNLRKKRLSLFKSLLALIPGDLKILDVGGRPIFWEMGGFFDLDSKEKLKNIEITLLNIEKIEMADRHPNLKQISGDARDLKQFKEREFDVVFSNSVIEHVGEYNDQLKMANEIRRVGKKYFIQTPNLYFPIEPHVVFPFYQFLPQWARVWLIMNFALGWFPKIPNRKHAIEAANSIKLLSKKQLISLFPTGNIIEEKFYGLTKSFIVYEGWEPSVIEQYWQS